MAQVVTCPFCGFKKEGEYAIQLHIEEHHTDDSPFISSSTGQVPAENGTVSATTPTDSDEWIKCTRPNCGEYMLLSDAQEHLDLHEAIQASEEELVISDRTNIQQRPGPKERLSKSKERQREPPRTAGGQSRSTSSHTRSSNSQNSTLGRTLLDYFNSPSSAGRPLRQSVRSLERPRQRGRLGKRELGPHAYEKEMPAAVRQRLLNDALPRRITRIGGDGRLVDERIIENETSGLIHMISDLCASDRSTDTTYLCHPSVRHIQKIRCDGNFCGYWNIQMLLSFIKHKHRDITLLPNVLEIQDTIEQAWDNGICAYGRIESGGLRGTRKYIGTTDAVAYFTQIGVNHQASAFKNEADGLPAVLGLLDFVEAYFMSGSDDAKINGTSRITNLAPIYFQRAGHSMTIVGLERRKDGHRNLLVFDPSFGTSDAMHRLLQGGRHHAQTHTLLRPYRRSDEVLSRWDEFEILVPQVESEQKGNNASGLVTGPARSIVQ